MDTKIALAGHIIKRTPDQVIAITSGELELGSWSTLANKAQRMSIALLGMERYTYIGLRYAVLAAQVLVTAGISSTAPTVQDKEAAYISSESIDGAT